MRVYGWLAMAAAFSLQAVLRPGLALAQSNEELEREIRELADKVKGLEQENRQLRALGPQLNLPGHKLEKNQEQVRDEAKAGPIVAVSQDGFYLKSADKGKAFNLRIGGYAQTDGRFYLSQTKPTGSEFLMRRARLLLEGTLAKYYDFRVMPDFGQGQAVLDDAYTDIHYTPQFRLRAGKYKAPIGLERLQDATNLKFVERALPTALVPNRDIGIDFHGDLFHDRLQYAIGVFNAIPNGTATVDAANADAKDFMGRIYLHPFAGTQFKVLGKLGLGIAATYGDTHSTTVDTYKSTGQFTFFTYNKNVVAAGLRYRYTPQFDWYWGPFGVLGEYVNNTQRLSPPVTIRKTIFPGPARTVSARAWQLQASYELTGEDNSYDSITPRQDFDPLGHGLGALELAGRIDQLLIDRDVYTYGLADKSTAANRAFEWSLGLNWYLNRNVKFQLDYDNTTFRFGGGGKNGNFDNEHALLSRVQLSF